MKHFWREKNTFANIFSEFELIFGLKGEYDIFTESRSLIRIDLSLI